jgi:hypothetical protein
MTRLPPIALALGLLLGCADTNAPPPDPIELLAVVNSQANTVTIAPVDQSEAPIAVQLGNPRGLATSIAARDRFAIVPFGDIDEVAVVDLVRRTMDHRLRLPPGAAATGPTMLDDSIGYVAKSRRTTVSQVREIPRWTVDVPVGVYP